MVRMHSEPIGIAEVPLNKIRLGEPIDEWFLVKSKDPNASIRLQIYFKSCSSNMIYRDGISDRYEMKVCYFPLRRGCEVTLYQDAHVGKEGTLPVVRLDGGRTFRNKQCWQDICSAIMEAKKSIYVMGWSVYVGTRLVREPTRKLPGGNELRLGDLLIRKANEGVKVVLLVWDDPTSLKVKQKVCGILILHIYTLTIRSVIVDTKDHSDNRKITAFLGDLDLTAGRYDTPEHRLYRDMETVFADDYKNPLLMGRVALRQPWHDLHCKIEGPGASDVLVNFEQRWLKDINSCKIRKLFKIIKGVPLELVDIENDPLIASPSAKFPSNHPEQWHVQIFRSIDSGSQEDDVDETEEQNKPVIDMSIQKAYVQAIRSAQHFIYIENQYFIGSSEIGIC
ncbi:hypothetical protein CASFOL_021984 [Castilleja foliolosa]|uniref:Phospholipase D n=1 Tax=Castilleja foliolosa TaxID=1961234 RepID=A0ABD3D1W6_9LAMI